MIKTVYIVKIYWEREYDEQEKEECLHDNLGKALVWLAKKGFTKMKLYDGNGRYEPFVCFEQGEHSAYIEVNTGDWVTAKEAKERGLDWE